MNLIKIHETTYEEIINSLSDPNSRKELASKVCLLSSPYFQGFFFAKFNKKINNFWDFLRSQNTKGEYNQSMIDAILKSINSF